MEAILTFHEIQERRSMLSFPPADLEALLERLLADGVSIVHLHELLQPPPSPGNRVALTFDDGMDSVHRNALPILVRLGVPALVYVVSDWVGRSNRWPSQPETAPVLQLMDWGQLKDLVQAGLEIGAHGVSHAPLTSLQDGDLDIELRRCREVLEAALQVPVRHFAYPYGAHSPPTTEHTGRYYQTAVTTRMRFLGHGEDPLRLPRIDAYYLRGPRSREPLFGGGMRRYLALRAGLRRLRYGVAG